MTQVAHEYYFKTSMKFKYFTQIQEIYTMYARITIALQVIKHNGEYHFQNTMIYLVAATSSKHAA